MRVRINPDHQLTRQAVTFFREQPLVALGAAGLGVVVVGVIANAVLGLVFGLAWAAVKMLALPAIVLGVPFFLYRRYRYRQGR